MNEGNIIQNRMESCCSMIFILFLISFSYNGEHGYTIASALLQSSTVPLLRLANNEYGGTLMMIKATIPEISYSCDLEIIPAIKLVDSSLTCYFDKTSSCSSCKSGFCPVDNRPCPANRDYMSHIYGGRLIPKPKPKFQAFKYSQQSQMHMHAASNNAVIIPPPTEEEKKLTSRERRKRRQKLFLMSTWLDDLLPNPSQGRSWMFNSLCDTLKITTKIGSIVISFVKMLYCFSFSPLMPSTEKENSDIDSTTHL